MSNYVSKLQTFSNQILSNLTVECIADARPSHTLKICSLKLISGTDESTNTYVYGLTSAIHDSLQCFFDDPDVAYGGEKLNFTLINSYADMSLVFTQYNSSTNKFDERYEYYYTRGNMYDMLPGAERADYLRNFYQYIKTIDSIVRQYQELFTEYKETWLPPDPPVPLPEDYVAPTALSMFWDLNYANFNTECLTIISNFDSIKADYESLPPLIVAYKKIITDMATITALEEYFIGSDTKTIQESGISAETVWNNIGTSGFNSYNTDIGKAFQIYLNAKTLYENSLTAFEKYSTLRKIVISKVCEEFNYFVNSETWYNTIKTFRTKYNI